MARNAHNNKNIKSRILEAYQIRKCLHNLSKCAIDAHYKLNIMRHAGLAKCVYI